jgi:PIN domain nuclease of toxin-antitoxin system
MVLLDTCCLIELCKSKPALSKLSLAKIEQGAHILSISFAEIALKVKLGRLIINITAQDLHSQYRAIPSVTIVDIGCQEWFDSIDLRWNHNDPADRLIVAYAQRHGLPIVSSDSRIKKYYKRVLW